MDESNRAAQRLARSKESYIRIIYLPPVTVAEINFYGETVLPGEDNYLSDEQKKETQPDKIMANHFTAGLNAVDTLIKDSNLAKIKPDFRLFGFANCSKMEEYGPTYGFGRWITIPGEMDVPFPFVKKQIGGGMYGAYGRPLPFSEGESDEWEVLSRWVCNNDKYEYDGSRGEPTCNYGMLEEYLNYMNIYRLPVTDRQQQTDLLMPIKEK